MGIVMRNEAATLISLKGLGHTANKASRKVTMISESSIRFGISKHNHDELPCKGFKKVKKKRKKKKSKFIESGPQYF